MKRAAALLVICWMAAGTSGVRGTEQTWTGAISDSMCGASHDGMRRNGQKVTDRECTVACLNYQTPGAPKYVFVSAGKVYAIANQKFAGLGRRAGEPIMLTGELDIDGAITITKVEPAKKG